MNRRNKVLHSFAYGSKNNDKEKKEIRDLRLIIYWVISFAHIETMEL